MLHVWLLGQDEHGLFINFFLMVICMFFGWWFWDESKNRLKTLEVRRNDARLAFYFIGLGFITLFISFWPFILFWMYYVAGILFRAVIELWKCMSGAGGAIRRYYEFAFGRDRSSDNSSSVNNSRQH